MEPQKTKTSASDFFLHLGFIMSLYAGVGFLLTVLFSVINYVYPAVSDYLYGSLPSISFPVAALIVLTPVFLTLGSIISKRESTNPSLHDSLIKRVFVYLTMFITGSVVIGDLITVLYYFLDGRDITVAFLYKVLALFVVLGAVFGYFYMNLKGTLSTKSRNAWKIGTVLFVIGTIVLGFAIIGSPRSQRLLRYDNQKVSDLVSIQSQVIQYWQSSKGKIPQSLEDLKDSLAYYPLPIDSQTSKPYEYRATGANSFELCAVFNLNATANQSSTLPVVGTKRNDNWSYTAGRFCFQRTIDPLLYPVYNTQDPKGNI